MISDKIRWFKPKNFNQKKRTLSNKRKRFWKKRKEIGRITKNLYNKNGHSRKENIQNCFKTDLINRNIKDKMFCLLIKILIVIYDPGQNES